MDRLESVVVDADVSSSVMPKGVEHRLTAHMVHAGLAGVEFSDAERR